MGNAISGYSGLVAAALLAASGADAFAAGKSADVGFIRNAIRSDISEAQIGELAQQKSQDADVKALGQMLVADNGQGRTEAETVAKVLKVHAPTTPNRQGATEYHKLSGLSGAAFDKEFADYMVKVHNKDIATFQNEVKDGNSEAEELAQKMVPVLQKHLAAAQALVKKLGAG
jgi:putative membrane protein